MTYKHDFMMQLKGEGTWVIFNTETTIYSNISTVTAVRHDMKYQNNLISDQSNKHAIIPSTA